MPALQLPIKFRNRRSISWVNFSPELAMEYGVVDNTTHWHSRLLGIYMHEGKLYAQLAKGAGVCPIELDYNGKDYKAVVTFEVISLIFDEVYGLDDITRSANRTTEQVEAENAEFEHRITALGWTRTQFETELEKRLK